MENNSYVMKRIYKMKKNSSNSSINSNALNHNLYTYELDKKEEFQNSSGASYSLIGNKFTKKNSSSDKNGSYVLINFNKNLSNKNDNASKSKVLLSLKEELGKKILVHKAPSIFENKKEINKIIKKKKLEKLIDFENFYSHIRTQHTLYDKNKSQILENNTNNASMFNAPYKIKKFKSSSCSNIFFDIINSKRGKKYSPKINTEDITKDKSFRYNTAYNGSHLFKRQRKRNRINKESTIINDNEKTNEEIGTTHTNVNNANTNNNSSVLMTLLPVISKSKKNKFKNKDKIKIPIGRNRENEETNLYNFPTQKIGFSILLYLQQKTKTIFQFTNLEKKMVKLKYFQNIQKKSLSNILLSDKFNINKKIDHLIKLNRLYNNLWTNYRQRMNSYLHFLFDVKDDLETDLEIILRKKKFNENIIEKLMYQTVRRQQDLEELVETRNFILQVKLRLLKQPAYFTTLLHRDSLKIQLGNIIITSTVGTKNSTVIKFLDSFSAYNLVQLYEIQPTNSLLKLFRKKVNNKRIVPKEFKEKYVLNEDILNNDDNSKYIPKKGEILFESPEKFLEIYQILEKKNVFFLNQNNNIKKTTSMLKKEYENYLLEQELLNKSEILEEIKYREKLLRKLKTKNNSLKEDLNHVSNEEFVDNNKFTKKLIQAKANSSFVELSFFKMVNYIKILEAYKYNGTLLLEKLISIIKTFINIKYGDYNLDRCYLFIEKSELDYIFQLDKNSFNENNKYKVYAYILELIKLYIDICSYVKNMQKIYEADAKKKIFMKKRREEEQTLRKIKNAREIRELLDEKREKIIEKVFEKNTKPVIKSFRKIDDQYNAKRRNKIRSKSIEDIDTIMKRKKQNEIDGLIFYE